MKNQSLDRFELFIKLLFISVSLLLVSVIFILFYVGYERTADFILGFYQVKDKSARFKAELLTPRTFEFIKFALVCFWLLFLLIGFIFKNRIHLLFIKISKVIEQFMDLLKSILKEIANLSASQKLIFLSLMTVIIATRLYYIFIFPLTNDEVFSYLYFVDKGFLVSISYYPGPNNHIFYSLLCILVDIFSDDPFFIMRFPILIVGMIMSFFMFILVNKKFGFLSSFFSTLFFSFSYDSFYYSLHGRGYALLSLFFLMSFFSFFKIFESNDSKIIYKIIFAVSTILGFYTIPTFLYPFLCFSLLGTFYLILKKEFRELKKFISLITFIGILTLLLYSPVILVSGIASLISNKWVTSLSFENFGSAFTLYLGDLFNYLWNIESIGLVLTVLLIVSTIFIFIKRKDYFFTGFIFIFFLLPFILMVIQKVLPPFRVMNYILVILSILSGIFLEALIDLFKIKIIRSFLFLSACLFIFLVDINYLYKEKERGFPYYTKLNTFVDRLLSEKLEKVFIREDTYQLFVKLKGMQTNNKVKVYTESAKNEKYDVVVIPAGTKFPAELNKSDYQRYICNGDIDSFKK